MQQQRIVIYFEAPEFVFESANVILLRADASGTPLLSGELLDGKLLTATNAADGAGVRLREGIPADVEIGAIPMRFVALFSNLEVTSVSDGRGYLITQFATEGQIDGQAIKTGRLRVLVPASVVVSIKAVDETGASLPGQEVEVVEPGRTFNVPLDARGEGSFLARPGHYIVVPVEEDHKGVHFEITGSDRGRKDVVVVFSEARAG